MLAHLRDLEVYKEFVKSCESNYFSSSNCTVDKSLHRFRGKCSFKVCIPNKPSKYKIKVYVVANNESLYSIKSKVYLGKRTHGNNSHFPILAQPVLESTDCTSKTNRNITIDNNYTSISLAKELKEWSLKLVGTKNNN